MGAWASHHWHDYGYGGSDALLCLKLSLDLNVFCDANLCCFSEYK